MIDLDILEDKLGILLDHEYISEETANYILSAATKKNEMAEYANESVRATVGETIRKHKDDSKLKKVFTKGRNLKHKTVEKEFSDTDIEKLRTLESNMRNSKSFSQYKPAFNKFCNMMGINATIIYKIVYDGNKVYVKYDDLDKEVTAPNGCTLTHISPNEFNELEPHFKSKSPTTDSGVSRGGYLYSSPRVYVTLNKQNAFNAKNAADIKSSTAINQYALVENIKSLKLDPAIIAGSNIVKPCYIETMFPIKVHKITKEDIEKEYAKYAKKKVAGAAVAGAVAGSVATAAIMNKHNKDSKK